MKKYVENMKKCRKYKKYLQNEKKSVENMKK